MDEEVQLPFSSAHPFFRPDETELRRMPRLIAPEPGDRNTCRWCLEKFDVTQQVRSTRERGALRTGLKMADDGTELVCCDACWQGANYGSKTLIQGRVVPADPEAIDNPLLRASLGAA